MISWKIIALVYVMCIFWLGYEVRKAPTMDDKGNLIKKNKKD